MEGKLAGMFHRHVMCIVWMVSWDYCRLYYSCQAGKGQSASTKQAVAVLIVTLSAFLGARLLGWRPMGVKLEVRGGGEERRLMKGSRIRVDRVSWNNQFRRNTWLGVWANLPRKRVKIYELIFKQHCPSGHPSGHHSTCSCHVSIGSFGSWRRLRLSLLSMTLKVVGSTVLVEHFAELSSAGICLLIFFSW